MNADPGVGKEVAMLNRGIATSIWTSLHLHHNISACYTCILYGYQSKVDLLSKPRALTCSAAASLDNCLHVPDMGVRSPEGLLALETCTAQQFSM